MLKRLLIAVFVLGLLMAFSGTAIADTSKGPLNSVIKIDPTNPRLNDLQKAGPIQPTTKKPVSAINKLPDGLTVPGPPLNYFCDLQDYTSGAAFYFWTIPDAYLDDLFNMRFDSDIDHDCSLKVADFLMYAPETVGSPDFRAYLWDDDGFGFPGNKIDSVDISNADILAAVATYGNLYWLQATFAGLNGGSDYIFSDGAKYHLGWTTLDNSGSGTDVLAIISDAAGGPYAGEERASENWNGAWGSMLNDWGLDVSFFIYAERCCGEIPFTDCYSELQMQNLAYFWRAPHLTYGDEAYSQKFNMVGQDTLVSIDFAIYDDAASPTSIDPAGNNTVFMTIYGDDGSGLPDPGNVIATSAHAPASYGFYPSLTTATFNIVLDPGPYHAAFSSDGVWGTDYESTLSSEGSDGVGGSASDWGGGFWVSMLAGWGLDVNFFYVVNVCPDEASICFSQFTPVGLNYFWRLPDQYGDTHNAQLVRTTGANCRVQEVAWSLYDNGSPGIYQHDAVVELYYDVGGLPGGPPQASITITPGQYVLFPGVTVVDFEPQDIYMSAPFWVSITSTSPAFDTTQGIRTLTDAGGSGANFESAEMWNGSWFHMGPDWGLPDDIAFWVETELCCIPFSEHTCAPAGQQWSTYQQDFGNTGRSELAVDDSWCDLTQNWAFEHPTSGVAFTGPIIHGDAVVCAFGSEYVKFNLADGTIIYTLSGGGLGSAIRCAPTVYNSANLGTEVLIVGGGDQQSVGCYNYATGAQIWIRDFPTYGVVYGQVRWGVFVVLDQAGTEVLYYGTEGGFDDASLVALELATGDLFTGWSVNPLNVPRQTFKGIATDGSQIFWGTYSAAGEGDIYAFDGATGGSGVPNWQLSVSGPLQGAAVWGPAYTTAGVDEGFQGLSYADGTVFANSRAQADFPTDGLFYRINAATGAVLDGIATLSNRAQYTSPIVDINRLYSPTLTRWAGPPAGGNLVAINRANGAVDFAVQSASGGRFYADGILTCEPLGVDDQFIGFNEDGFLTIVNAETGDEIYRRRIFNVPGYSPNLGMGGAIGAHSDGTVHVVFASFWGNLIDMTKQGDRSRAQFSTWAPTFPVDFGAAANLIVDVGTLITNTGCVDLTFSAVTVTDFGNGIDIPGFGSKDGGNLMDRTSSIANQLTVNSDNKMDRIPRRQMLTDNDYLTVRNVEKQDYYNPSASAFPNFINGVTSPSVTDVVPPGGTVNLIIDVIQANILRGPQRFYVEFETNDPDPFLNNLALLPQILVTIVGGCLVDTTRLEFGIGAANIQLVTNTGRLGTGDWSPHGFDIDGDDASYFQGSYVYGVSTHRIATHTQNWSGGGEALAFVSLQPDPNWCDTDCKPELLPNVSLGSITSDGINYTLVMGDVICKSYLDSVQNFGSPWDWFSPDLAPFDNDSTMGLYVNARVVGAVGIPELASLTLEISEITERNGNSVPDWIFAHIADYDNGASLPHYSAAASASWSEEPGAAGSAWGQIKIPFGDCSGQDPMINTVGLDGDVALWQWDLYWDSSYIYMSEYTGLTDLSAGGDAELHNTIIAHDFGPGETISFGVVNFGLHGADYSTDADIIDLANLVNKWAGFGRGDVNDDGNLGNLADIIALASFVNAGGAGPIPFMHLGDVNCDGNVDNMDVTYLIDYYFCAGSCPCGDWIF